MRAALILLLGCAPLFPADFFWGEDKARHFMASAVASGTLAYITAVNHPLHSNRPAEVSLTVTLSLGLLKEIYDGRKRGNHFCLKDLFWDAVGAGVGIVPVGILARP